MGCGWEPLGDAGENQLKTAEQEELKPAHARPRGNPRLSENFEMSYTEIDRIPIAVFVPVSIEASSTAAWAWKDQSQPDGVRTTTDTEKLLSGVGWTAGEGRRGPHT